jgi:opine dehydrogenase
MREDIKLGLVLIASVGAWAGVETPLASGLVAVASAICGEAFRDTGRSMRNLGLDGFDRGAMGRLLEEGI